MTTQEKINSIKEFINDTREQMKTSPKDGIAGTIVNPHSVMQGWIEQAEQQINQLEARKGLIQDNFKSDMEHMKSLKLDG